MLDVIQESHSASTRQLGAGHRMVPTGTSNISPGHNTCCDDFVNGYYEFDIDSIDEHMEKMGQRIQTCGDRQQQLMFKTLLQNEDSPRQKPLGNGNSAIIPKSTLAEKMLALCSRKGYSSAVSSLAKRCKAPALQTALLKATKHNRANVVKELLKCAMVMDVGNLSAASPRVPWNPSTKKLHLATTTKTSLTALMIASQNGFEGIVRALLAHDSSIEHIEALDARGQTALMHASSEGHYVIVKLLLEASSRCVSFSHRCQYS